MKPIQALLLSLVLLVSGCGYKLGEIRPTPMRSVRTLSVPNFKNETFESRIEVLFGDTLVKRLQQDGTYQLVNSGQADAILSCTITNIRTNSLRSVINNVLATSEFGLIVDVSYEVTHQGTGAILMQGKVIGKSSFFSGNDLQTSKQQALSNAASDLADKLTAQVAEGW
jgi:outer membrane lipopolysaccharide assembly protein LptE/RlpB